MSQCLLARDHNRRPCCSIGSESSFSHQKCETAPKPERERSSGAERWDKPEIIWGSGDGIKKCNTGATQKLESALLKNSTDSVK